MENTSLIKPDIFQQALAEASTIPEVKNLADQADLFRQWLKKQRVGLQAQNTGAIMCLQAQRKLGGMLAENREITKGSSQMYHGGTFQSLKELNIDRHNSSRWHLQPADLYKELGYSKRADVNESPWEGI